ncbi:hypothetical protein NGM99_13650 [Mesorhizobium sp. RP14(2022)]|uniref:Uncharacterized protein n=1 Tax=Mesorhizobium liriopis TaxID=2953882 RepID=A0ABT1C7K6_9HYPH|nr:hypothetical protein [Mesorhizobium liriopis]MCO6050823.1 hypothetical protein [Mesorhizobium liriopis]
MSSDLNKQVERIKATILQHEREVTSDTIEHSGSPSRVTLVGLRGQLRILSWRISQLGGSARHAIDLAAIEDEASQSDPTRSELT